MEVKQIAELANTISQEVLGTTDIVSEDLQGVIDLGEAVFNANAYDNYVKSLVDHIGKVIFVDRAYEVSTPSVLMDGWEYGSVLEKISGDIPEATENESWELEDGTSYDPNIFTKPVVSAKFFNAKTTFEVPSSITKRQVVESFSSPTQYNSFISMLRNNVEKSITIKLDSLILRTINNMTGETLYDYNTTTWTGEGNTRAINLLARYNTLNSTSLTAEAAIYDQGFLRYASSTIDKTIKRLRRASTLFNVGGATRFTPEDLTHLVVLSDFASNMSYYLESDTYHNDLVSLPNYETVPYWQASGDGYAFDDISKIDITTSAGHAVSTTGILAVVFDRDALGVLNYDRRTPTQYNAKAEFWNYWDKVDCQYFNDLNENFIVFYVA